MQALKQKVIAAGRVQFSYVGAAAMDSRRCAIVALRRRAVLDQAAVDWLRREIFSMGDVSRDEADALFELERAAIVKDESWSEFFVEAVASHVVWDARPTGIVNESQGEWLIQSADKARTPAAFALLVHVLDVAHRTPMWFAAAVKARAARGWPGVTVGSGVDLPARLA